MDGLGTTRRLAEGESLLSVGDTPRCAYYILKGALRTFVILNDLEITLEFFFENQGVSSFTALRHQWKSEYAIDAVEDTEVIEIPLESLAKLRQTAGWLETYCSVLEDRLEYYINRTCTLLTLNAAERYDDLVDRSPDLVERIKQKYLASYIGITPESLSRIRRARARS